MPAAGIDEKISTHTYINEKKKIGKKASKKKMF